MRDLIFSLIYNLGIPGILRRCRVKNKELSVLMLHRVSDESDPLWPCLPIKSFRFLIKELSKKTEIIPLENIEKIKEYPDRPLVALSFDDGYRDFWENALAILSDFKIPAHHNICPALIDQGIPPWTQILNNFLQCNSNKNFKLPGGKNYRIKNRSEQSDFINLCDELYALDDKLRNDWANSLINQIPEEAMTKLMNWDQIRECAKSGIHIGSHGASHLNLSKIEDENSLSREIKESKKRILQEIGIEPLIFAFPNGLYNSLSMGVVKKSGYKVALLCEDKVASFSEDNQRNNFYIFPRINIARANWKEENLRLLGFHQKIKSWLRK